MLGRDAEIVGYLLDRLFAGRVHLERQAVFNRGVILDRLQLRGGFLHVGRVAALRATGYQVLTGIGVDHELVRLRSPHRPRVRFDGDVLQTAAFEDAAVRLIVLLVADVESGGVEVERVRVLHGELPRAQQTGLGAGLVAELRLDLIPDLRQLLVAAQFAAGDFRHDLFLGHAETQVGPLAVLELEHVVAHHGPAPAGFPDLPGMDGRQIEFLRDLVHLLAHDAHDLQNRALAQRQIGINAGAELAHVTGAQQEFVTGDFGVGRSLTKSGDEKF